MRTIKFRQWMGDRFEYWGVNFDEFRQFVGPHSGNKLNAGNTVHQQFTGLHDKTGREIYEGDVVIWESDAKSPLAVDHEMNGQLGEVKWFALNAQFCFYFRNGRYCHDGGHTIQYRDRCRVIGNIYENLGLLL